VDLGEGKVFISLDPAVGKSRKVSVAAVEELRGKSGAQSGKEMARNPMVAKADPNDISADGASDHSQNTLESKEQQPVYTGNSASGKAPSGEFNILISDKMPHEAPDVSRDGAQRSNAAVTFITGTTVSREGEAAPADVPANSWRPVVERISGEIAGRIKLNHQNAIIQLDPPELGRIKIDLHVDGDKLQARIFTEGHESQSLIENHLAELRQALQENHVDLVDVRVQGGWNGASGDAMHGFSQQQQQQPASHQRWDSASGNVVDRDAVEPQPNYGSTSEQGRVSMWA
jgi:flagellar hook-length control protein FliK